MVFLLPLCQGLNGPLGWNKTCCRALDMVCVHPVCHGRCERFVSGAPEPARQDLRRATTLISSGLMAGEATTPSFINAPRSRASPGTCLACAVTGLKNCSYAVPPAVLSNCHLETTTIKVQMACVGVPDLFCPGERHRMTQIVPVPFFERHLSRFHDNDTMDLMTPLMMPAGPLHYSIAAIPDVQQGDQDRFHALTTRSL
ncbi:hypothetical protein B0T22DRAFT_82114 [Podospora appendiculata]|uniref:Uncharacterized protein n=1 Tax=Podospora appendiculata TaxID=314037 RepID=A0AAE0XJX9_9PEZI|nr:hypothetical protein B0T22DRAFT_82114 [Podospora appendiculata]